MSSKQDKSSALSSGYQESKRASSASAKVTSTNKTAQDRTISQQPTQLSSKPYSQQSRSSSQQKPSAAHSTQLSSSVVASSNLVPNESEYIVGSGEIQNTYLFNLGPRKTVFKPIKNSVYYAKLFFLSFQSFNLVYLGTVIYFMFKSKDNKDFSLFFYGELGLSIMTIIFNIRIFKSLYGIYAVLFARSRRPLYLFLLFNYFVSCLYILLGLIALFTPFIKNRFEAAMRYHIRDLTNHFSKEQPTWYLVENVQHFGECCGYHSLIDFLDIYRNERNTEQLNDPSFDLPLTCCKNAVRGDTCNSYKRDLILKGCAKFLNHEVVNNINLPILILLFCDVFSLIFIVFLMRKFKDNLVKIEIKEDFEKYLNREETRFVQELVDAKVIKDFEKDKVKDKFRKCIKLELAITLRPTIEGLTLLVRKDGNLIELRALNPGKTLFN